MGVVCRSSGLGRMNRFISEKEINENRERFGVQVKGEDEHYDPRPLFEKLAEKRELADEAMRDRLKSLPPPAMDEDEYEFLRHQENIMEKQERQRQTEEEESLREFLSAQARVVVDPVQDPPSVTSPTEPPKHQEPPKKSLILCKLPKGKKPKSILTKKPETNRRAPLLAKTIQKPSRDQGETLTVKDKKLIVSKETAPADALGQLFGSYGDAED